MKIINSIFYTNNISKTRESYEALGFILNDKETSENFLAFETQDKEVFFGINFANNDLKVPGAQAVVIKVEDLEKFYEKAKEIGFAIEKDIHKSHYGRTFTCRDFDGNKLMVVGQQN